MPQTLEDEAKVSGVKSHYLGWGTLLRSPPVLAFSPLTHLPKAVEDLYLAAVTRGHTNAANALGQIYGSGLGRPADKEKAEHFWEIAANQGNNPMAQCCLGVLVRMRGLCDPHT